jgi:hypothetical protein
MGFALPEISVSFMLFVSPHHSLFIKFPYFFLTLSTWVDKKRDGR